MPLPVQLREFDYVLDAGATTTISAGFTVAMSCPGRGEIIGVYVAPIDGTTAITGTSAVLTISAGGVAGATVTCLPATSGFATGTTAASGQTLSARQFVNEGDIIKLVLAGGGLTCAVNAVCTVVVRARSI